MRILRQAQDERDREGGYTPQFFRRKPEFTGLPWLAVRTISSRERRRAVGSCFRRNDGVGWHVFPYLSTGTRERFSCLYRLFKTSGFHPPALRLVAVGAVVGAGAGKVFP